MWFTGGDHRFEPPPSSAISVKLRTPRLQLRYGDDDVDGALDAGVTIDPAACMQVVARFQQACDPYKVERLQPVFVSGRGFDLTGN